MIRGRRRCCAVCSRLNTIVADFSQKVKLNRGIRAAISHGFWRSSSPSLVMTHYIVRSDCPTTKAVGRFGLRSPQPDSNWGPTPWQGCRSAPLSYGGLGSRRRGPSSKDRTAPLFLWVELLLHKSGRRGRHRPHLPHHLVCGARTRRFSE